MNNRIFFFKTKDEKVFVLSKKGPIEIANPKTPNKEEILSIAKLYSQKSNTRLSNKCFKEYNAKATFSINIDTFIEQKIVNLDSELRLLE